MERKERAHLKKKKKHNPVVKRRAEICWGKQGVWSSEQKARAAKLEKQLKARWAVEQQIVEQLNSFQAHYARVMVPIRLRDVARLLMPAAAPPSELAAFTWLGDWRPSSILHLLASLSESSGVARVLPRLINEIRVEEAVIDEQMAEVQATCVLHLPFGQTKNRGSSPLQSVEHEFQNIHNVLIKAQNLRLKTLGLVSKKVLSQTDAAEFLVAFSAIQDSIHQFITHRKLGKPSRLPLPLDLSGIKPVKERSAAGSDIASASGFDMASASESDMASTSGFNIASAAGFDAFH